MAKDWKEYNRIPEKIKKRLELLNDLSGSEWTKLSKSVNLFNGPIPKKRKVIGAAYPITLAKHIIKIYTKQGDTVLDPFAGVGTTLDAAKLLGRNAKGFEINPEFFELAKSGVDELDCSEEDFQGKTEISIYQETCLNLNKHIPSNSIDLILTSPPYSNLLNNTISLFTGSTYDKNIYNGRELAKPYSSYGKDFGNMDWNKYCESVGSLMENLFEVSREGCYNVWVVRDFRDMKEHMPYVNLHGKIIELATNAGWILTDIMIWDQTNQRKLVKMGGPKSRRFYLNIGHSFNLIFRKNIEGESFKNEY